MSRLYDSSTAISSVNASILFGSVAVPTIASSAEKLKSTACAKRNDYSSCNVYVCQSQQPGASDQIRKPMHSKTKTRRCSALVLEHKP